MTNRIVLGALVLISSLPALALEIDAYRLVDLSHSYGENTLYWPTSPTAFEKEQLAYGISDGGWFYSAYSVCTPEHGGTHIDAPIHFAAGGDSTEKIPLESLLAQAIVIDVSKKAAADRNYRLTADDVREFEKEHGEISAGTIVLMRTDWSNHWPDAIAYLGDDTPGDASKLQFPGFGAEATRILTRCRAGRCEPRKPDQPGRIACDWCDNNGIADENRGGLWRTSAGSCPRAEVVRLRKIAPRLRWLQMLSLTPCSRWPLQ